MAREEIVQPLTVAVAVYGHRVHTGIAVRFRHRRQLIDRTHKHCYITALRSSARWSKYIIVSIFEPADDPNCQHRSGFLHKRAPESSWIHPLKTDIQGKTGNLNYGSSPEGCRSGPAPVWGRLKKYEWQPGSPVRARGHGSRNSRTLKFCLPCVFRPGSLRKTK